MLLALFSLFLKSIACKSTVTDVSIILDYKKNVNKSLAFSLSIFFTSIYLTRMEKESSAKGKKKLRWISNEHQEKIR